MKKIFFALGLVFCLTSFACAEEVYTIQGVNPSGTQTQSPAVDNNFNLKIFSKNDVDYVKVPPGETQTIKLSMNRLKSDPYYIKVNGVKYYMVIKSANGVYSIKNILGYRDKKTDLFASLKSLNTNKDNKITVDELTKANIRLVALSSNNKLLIKDSSKDFNLNNINYIDIANIRQSENGGTLGTFGYFNVYLKNPDGTVKKVIGQVTFEDDAKLQKLL